MTYAQILTPISLNDALEQAVQKRIELKIQQTNIAIADNERKKVVAKGLPQITGTLDSRYNSQLQTQILPAAFGASTGHPGETTPVKFGTTFNTSLAANLTQNIYNPTNAGDKQITHAQAEYQRLSLQLNVVDIKQQVTEAYFLALLWKEKTDLASLNVSRTTENLQTFIQQQSQGTSTVYDKNKAQIDVENAKSEYEQNKRNFQVYLDDLIYKIGNDSLKSISLSDKIDDLFSKYSTDDEEEQLKRPELTLEKKQFEINSLNIKKQNLSYIPTVSLYANYTLQYLNNSFTPLNTSAKGWYPYNYLGVLINIPIFDGFQKERNKSEFVLRNTLSKYNYQKLIYDYTQESKSAKTTLNNSLIDLNYQKKNLDLSNELYKIDTDRLKNGTIRPTDLASTYYTLQQSQNNYLNAVYNYLVAVVRYKKATGTL